MLWLFHVLPRLSPWEVSSLLMLFLLLLRRSLESLAHTAHIWWPTDTPTWLSSWSTAQSVANKSRSEPLGYGQTLSQIIAYALQWRRLSDKWDLTSVDEKFRNKILTTANSIWCAKRKNWQGPQKCDILATHSVFVTVLPLQSETISTNLIST